MLEQDYIVRLLVEFIAAILRSLKRAKGERDLSGAAQILEDSITSATDMNGVALLSLAPESLAQVLQVSNTDPRVVVYIANSLALEAKYKRELGEDEIAKLRASQAEALAKAYGIELSDELAGEINEISDDALEKSLEEIANK